MKRLTVLYEDREVGQLLAQGGSHYFSFTEAFLAAPLPLSPYQLPTTTGTSEHAKGHFLTLPGMIYDSLPDRFGMSVLRRAFQDKGIMNPCPLELLSYLGERTMGALTYAPADDDPKTQEVVDLIKAATSARAIVAMEHETTLDPAIVKAGGTAGGATPKILASYSTDRSRIITGANEVPEGMEAWIIKLNTNEDKVSSICQLEKTYFDMARTAGITVPETMLIADRSGIQHFAIQRFDRSLQDPNKRIHTHSYAGLAGIDFSTPTADYEQLLRVTKNLTRNFEDVTEQFRRMLFNLLASNRDDHAKNFSFAMDDVGQWRNTPAYDLLYTDNELGGNWMLVGGKRNNITYDDLKKLSDLMGIPEQQLKEMIAQIRDALAQWPILAQANGIGSGLRKVVQTVLRSLDQTL